MSDRISRLRALRPRLQTQRTRTLKMETRAKLRRDAMEAQQERRARDTRKDSDSGDPVKKKAAKDSKGSAEHHSEGTSKHHEKSNQKSLKSETKKNKEASEKGTTDAFRCTQCPFTGPTRQALEIHNKMMHLKRRFFRCTKCCYVTHVRARYTKHVKYHSMPMIKCHGCDFRTPYKWNLDRHTRNHGGGGAFQCRACDFTADIRQSLTVHETNHHDPPLHHDNRKIINSLERKNRNGPKRYNQVGASDYREKKEPQDTETVQEEHVINPTNNTSETIPMDTDCISLKCEESGCQFVTAWNSEMQRHLVECHQSPSATPTKMKKPLPMLIPLGSSNESKSPTTIQLKVPPVRVRPELVQDAPEAEIVPIRNSKSGTEASPKKSSLSSGQTDVKKSETFEKKNATFFDKLKEKLGSSTSNTSTPEVVISGNNVINKLKCWCTFEAKNAEDLAAHKQSHHSALSVSLGVARCPKCRRRCKTSKDLEAHIRICRSAGNVRPEPPSFRGEYTFPAQAEWTAEHGNEEHQPRESSQVAGAPTNSSGRRVFKCPHCPFWASTASRFHVHIVGHLNRKPFECSLCSYRSNWRWDITKHIKLKAARDPAHLSARVLMTDETGRRNYSKYNKYLAQIEQQQQDQKKGHSQEESEEPVVKKATNSTSKEDHYASPYSPSSAAGQAEESPDVSPRSMPALKTSQGHSVLRGQSASGASSESRPISTSPTMSGTEEVKRTVWKCKRCNYRDTNKDALLLHVKRHYESPEYFVGDKVDFCCEDCPFTASDAATLLQHRGRHQQNLNAIFKCYLCPYYVSTKTELLEHVKVHGEDISMVTSKGEDSSMPSLKRKLNDSFEKVTEISRVSIQDTSMEIVPGGSNSTTPKGDSSAPKNTEGPSFLLDTRDLPEAPLVWVSRPDGTLAKMLKCRYCPYVSSRRAEVRDHETMHANLIFPASPIACPDCCFTCSRRDIMDNHANMHAGALGTVHCLVDDSRPDSQQLNDLTALLGLAQAPILGADPDLRDPKLVYCCNKCPARFLCERDLRIHLRYHSAELAYTCQWCSYSARQPNHLIAHQKAHSALYQERTRYLLSIYGYSQRNSPPSTACVEATDHTPDGVTGEPSVAWIVVEASGETTYGDGQQNLQRGNQVFTCSKCPARYFKVDALEYHMTLHGSNNRFRCTECDYSSKTAQNLVKHQVVHRRHAETNEVTVVNPVVQQPTVISSNVDADTWEAQLAAHSRGNPNFVYQGVIKNGRLKEKRYKCHKCPSAFEKREQFRVHLTLHGAKQRYCCDLCDYSVKYYANYVQHLKKHEANDQAQQNRNAYDRDVENLYAPYPRGTKSPKKCSNPMSVTNGMQQTSNQDKQSMMLMQKRENHLYLSEDSLRCHSCPFSTNDKEALDSHKRRHGIERMSPPCPHCDYVPRKDENPADHVKLHFMRLYKPESYVIVELVSLKMRKAGMDNAKDVDEKVIFQECPSGRYLPENGVRSPTSEGLINGYQESVYVDPFTGEQQLAT